MIDARDKIRWRDKDATITGWHPGQELEGVWNVPGCPQGFWGSRGGRVLARDTQG